VEEAGARACWRGVHPHRRGLARSRSAGAVLRRHGGGQRALWRNVSTDTWVSFKAFGFLPLTFLFAVRQVPPMQRHGIEAADEGMTFLKRNEAGLSGL
jgi:hypothetical protein